MTRGGRPAAGTRFYRINAQYVRSLCCLKFGQYGDGSVSLTLLDKQGQQMAVVTVCLLAQELLPQPGNVFIKSWGECEGMLATLQANAIVGSIVRIIPTGYTLTYEVPLLVVR